MATGEHTPLTKANLELWYRDNPSVIREIAEELGNQAFPEDPDKAYGISFYALHIMGRSVLTETDLPEDGVLETAKKAMSAHDIHGGLDG